MSPTRAFAAAALALLAIEPAAAAESFKAYKKNNHALRCETSFLGVNGVIIVTNTTQQAIPMSASIEIRLKIKGTVPWVEKKFVRVSDQLKTPKTEIEPGRGAWMLARKNASACWAYVALSPRVSR